MYCPRATGYAENIHLGELTHTHTHTRTQTLAHPLTHPSMYIPSLILPIHTHAHTNKTSGG